MILELMPNNDDKSKIIARGALPHDSVTTSYGLATYERGTNGCALTSSPAGPSPTMR